MDSRERRRRFWHMAPGVLPFLLWSIPHADPISPTLRLIIILIAAGMGMSIYTRYGKIARREDKARLTSVVGYAGCVVAALLLFASAMEIGLTVLAILAFGDGTATLAGRLFRGPALPWNREKTWAGFTAFLLVGTPLSAVVYWGESHNLEAVGPAVSFSTALVIAASATLPAAVAESLKLRWNDNFRVGITAAVALALLHGSLVGWH